MAADLYDVFVVGPIDPNPAAEARLIASLATRLNLPAAKVAAGIAERNFLVGHGLGREAAEAMVHAMQQVGALTAVRRATATFAPVQTAIPTPLHGFAATPAAAGRTLYGVGPTPAGADLAPAAASAGPSGGSPFSLAPLGAPPANGAGVGLRPLAPASTGPSLGAGLAAAAPAAADPFAPPPQVDLGANGLAPASPGPPRHHTPIDSPVTGANPFGAPMGDEAPLELDLPADRKTNKPQPDPAHSLPGTSALNISKLSYTKSASGLDVDGEQENSAYIERCGIHGLLFDKRKSSGCRKCLTSARSASRGRPGTSLRDTPTRRAFIGLFLALAIGFLPAVFYALGPGAAETGRLRSEQKTLSRTVGTVSNLERFDALEAMVASSHLGNARNTLFIWVGVGALVMVIWYRST